MFEACPRCGRFETRFDFKWTFNVVGTNEYLEFVKTRDWSKYVGKKLCQRCRRILRRKDSSCWFAYMLVTAMKKVSENCLVPEESTQEKVEEKARETETPCNLREARSFSATSCKVKREK